jgi:hypothetical protein
MPYLDPRVWGPHFWFFLHTVSMTYPHHPNTVTKKKYYEFIQNLPEFIPLNEIANDLRTLINKYPVTPYLDDRESFIKWVHFIHNKINEKLEKPTLTLNEFYLQYYENYKLESEKTKQFSALKKKLVYVGIVSVIAYAIYILYDK